MKLGLIVIAISFACSISAGSPPKHGKLNLAWVIKPWVEKNGNPHSRLSLAVNGKAYLISPDLQEKMSVLGREVYEPSEVPKDALIACSGWFAGAGDKFYVVRRAGSLRVYQQMGDCSPDSGEQPWRRVKTIRI